MITLLDIGLVEDIVVISFDYESDNLKVKDGKMKLSKDEWIYARQNGDDGFLIQTIMRNEIQFMADNGFEEE